MDIEMKFINNQSEHAHNGQRRGQIVHIECCRNLMRPESTIYEFDD